MTDTYTIYHNPRCSKSRATLKLLEDHCDTHGGAITIIEYLNTPPSAADLADLLTKLGIDAQALVRRKEAAFKEQALNASSTDTQLLEAMAAAPILIERPIVVHGERAVLGRPPENVQALFA